MRILVWVESLQGYGHALRTIHLLRLLQPTEAFILSGSLGGSNFLRQELGSFNLVELSKLTALDVRRPYPPLSESGVPIDQLFHVRSQTAIEAVTRLNPDILLIEHFPFGRHGFAPELLPFLQWVKTNVPNCRVIGSARDIPRARLLTSRQTRLFEQGAAFCDRLLIHGDSTLFSVEKVCGIPETTTLNYTGFIAPPRPYIRNQAAPWLLDLAGGWSSGALFATVASASSVASVPFRTVAGMHNICFCGAENTDSAMVVRDRSKTEAGVLDARLAITRVGYNSALEILLSDVPAILIPHHDSSEQCFRAQIISGLQRAPTLTEPELRNDPSAILKLIPIAEAWADKWDRRQMHPFLADGARLRTFVTAS